MLVITKVHNYVSMWGGFKNSKPINQIGGGLVHIEELIVNLNSIIWFFFREYSINLAPIIAVEYV